MDTYSPWLSRTSPGHELAQHSHYLSLHFPYTLQQTQEYKGTDGMQKLRGKSPPTCILTSQWQVI